MTVAVKDTYQFTQDWFHWAPPLLEKIRPLLADDPLHVLELGSFEGRATVWFMENWLRDGGAITCVDTWGGGADHADMGIDWQEAKERFFHNAQLAASRTKAEFYPRQSASHEWLRLCTSKFDFVYVDGSHVAKDVLADAVLAWPLLVPGGVMVFDDYLWGDPADLLNRPKLAVEAFMNIYADEIEIVHTGYQAAIRKKGE